MRKALYLFFFVWIAFVMTGCVQNQHVCNVSEVQNVDKEVSQCARRVDNVIYKQACNGCGDFGVTVRRHNCCASGGCQ
jgi:hypothetical protein